MRKPLSLVMAVMFIGALGADIAAGSENGLVGSYYDNRDFTNRRVVRVDSTVDFNWGSGAPAPEIGADTFSVRCEGQIEAPVAGSYLFHTYSDDGVRLWLDDVLIIDNWTDHAPTENSSAAITLAAGQRCNLRLEMYENGGGAVLSLRWTKPDGTKEAIPSTQLYLPDWYVNPPTVTSTVPADGGGIDALNPSVSITFSKPMDQASVEAAFSMNALSGSFSWSCETMTFKPLPPLSPNGTYTVAIAEGAQAFDGTVLAPFAMTVSTGTYNGFLAQYFDTMELQDVKLSRIDQTVNFDWGSGSPSSLIAVDTFSARWTGYIEPLYSETYTFSIYIDNGVRLWVDGQQIIDDWQDVPPRTVAGTIALVAGQKYPVKLEFFENYGGAQVKFYWESASQPKEIVPAQYLFVPDNAPLPSAPTNVSFSHIADRTLVLTWQPPADDSPIGRYEIYRDGAYVASTGLPEYRDSYLTPGETYSYAIRSVSPVGGMSDFTAPVSATTLAPAEIGTGTGLLGKYYDTIDFHERKLVRTDAVLDFNWGTGAPDAVLEADTFSVRWEGKVQPQYSEEYTFYSLSDDGVVVWVNGQPVIDNWTDHGAREDRGTITLQAGQQYDIRVDYYENGGYTRLALMWESLSQPKEVVATTQLYPAEFLGGADIRLSTNELSPVSPAWVEGKCSEEANVSFVLDGETLSAGRLNSEAWYVDAASGAGLSFGVVLDPENGIPLDVTADDGAGSTQSVGYTLIWSPTKLNGKSWSEDEILVRKGDSLLFVVENDTTIPPLDNEDPQVEIQVEGTSVEALTGNIDQRLPHQFVEPGIYTVTAWLRGEEIGSMTVKVLSVDLHVPIAAVLNYERELGVYVQTAGQADQIAFQAADQAELSVGTKEVTADGATLTLKPRVLTDSALIARLGGATGPMIAREVLEVFKMDSLNSKIMAFTRDEDDFGTGVLRIKITPRTVIANDKPETPEVEGLHFDLTLRGSGVFFSDNGQTTIRVPSTQEDEDGILKVYIQISPNGILSCHDVKAVQINSEQVIGGGFLNNPPLVDAKGYLYLVRELSDEVDRTEEQLGVGLAERNLEPPDAPNGKQKYQVWDREDNLDGRWTQAIKPEGNDPASLEAAFWNGQRMVDGPSPNRWFTVKIQGTKAAGYNPWAVRLEVADSYPPVGGASLGDNGGADRDELTTSPGKLVWANGKPQSFPAINQAPNLFRFDFDGGHESQMSWDTSTFNYTTEPTYTDIGFFKGNMAGRMDAWIGCLVGLNDTVKSVVTPRTNEEFSHNHQPQDFKYWTSTFAAEFPDLVTVGRLEADGYKGESDKSSRDKFPDIIGANVYEVPSGGAEPYLRTVHVGMEGEAMPMPVQITFRAGPGDTVKAAVSIATRDRSGAKEGLKTHKAWVSLSDKDIYEYRGQNADSDELKAQKVFKVIGFEPSADPADGLDYTKPIVEPAERVVTFDIVADGSGFGSQTVYVYGIEESVDRLDELKLVVWGEEYMGWKAKVISNQDHHNQNQELVVEQAPHGEIGNAIYRWWITDEEPLNVVRVEIVTPDPGNGNALKPTDAISASFPRPVLHVASPRNPGDVAVTDGQIVFVLEGSVTDAFADVVPNGSANVTSITVKVISPANGYTRDIPVTPVDGGSSLLRPYAFEGQFAEQIAFPASEGLYTVMVETNENIIGRTGCVTLQIQVKWIEDIDGNEFLVVDQVINSNSNLQDFFQPFLVRVHGRKEVLDGMKSYLYDNEFALKQGPDGVIYFSDPNDKPVVAAYLSTASGAIAPNLSGNSLIEGKLDPERTNAFKLAMPVTPARFVVPDSNLNAVRIHRPEVFEKLRLRIIDAGGSNVREFSNILPGDFLWDAIGLTEGEAPFTFEFHPRYKSGSRCAGLRFEMTGIQLEENSWSLRVPGQPGNPSNYASGVDAETISLDSLEVKVTPDGGAQKTVSQMTATGNKGNRYLDADVSLEEADGTRLVVYTTPFYPIDIKYEIALKQREKHVMDTVKNKWDFDPATPELDTEGAQRFGVQPRGDSQDVRELENNFYPGGEPIVYDILNPAPVLETIYDRK